MNIPFLLLKVKLIDDEYGIGHREDVSHAKKLFLTLALIQGLLEANNNATGSSENENESDTDTKWYRRGMLLGR